MFIETLKNMLKTKKSENTMTEENHTNQAF